MTLGLVMTIPKAHPWKKYLTGWTSLKLKFSTLWKHCKGNEKTSQPQTGRNICKKKRWGLSSLQSKCCSPTPGRRREEENETIIHGVGPGHTLLDNFMDFLEGPNKGLHENSSFWALQQIHVPWKKHILKPHCTSTSWVRQWRTGGHPPLGDLQVLGLTHLGLLMCWPQDTIS